MPSPILALLWSPPVRRKSFELYVQALKFFADGDAQSHETNGQDPSSTDDGFSTPTPDRTAVSTISPPLCERTSPRRVSQPRARGGGPEPRNKSKRKLDHIEEDERNKIHEQPRALRSSQVSEFGELNGAGVTEQAQQRPRFRRYWFELPASAICADTCEIVEPRPQPRRLTGSPDRAKPGHLEMAPPQCKRYSGLPGRGLPWISTAGESNDRHPSTNKTRHLSSLSSASTNLARLPRL